MAENITRTIYGSFLQTVKYLGLPFSLVANTTLNERFAIQQGVAPSAGTVPDMGYIAIGNGGHQMSVGADNIPYPEPLQHEATDAACFRPLPFVLRLPTNDLTQQQQAGYALRQLVTYNGTQYVAYWLKRIDLSSVTAVMNSVTVASGVSTITPFVPNSSNLNPTPPTISSNGVSVVQGDYVSASAAVGVIFAAFDAAELLNVATIIYGTPDAAIISEIAMCSGVDKAITVTPSSGPAYTFQEAIAVQVASFIATMILFNFNNSGTTVNLDMGCTEPLYVTS